MKFINLRGVLCALLICFSQIFALDIVPVNQNIISDQVAQKIKTIGDELFSKTGIYAGVGAFSDLGGKSMADKFKELNLKSPYAFLMLAKDEKKVEIFADEATLKLFDKEAILSPYPSKGTILPILTSKNGRDIYNAALLNGYADLAEQIADAKGVKLENAIGSQNKIFLEIIRFFVYGSIIAVIAVTAVKKFRRKDAK